MSKSEKTKKNELNSTKNTKKLKIILFGLLIVLILAVAAALYIFIPSKNFIIAFYGISDKQQQGITSVIENIAQEKNLTINFVQYDSEKSLASQIPISRKPNILFTTSGEPARTAIEKSQKKAGVSAEIISGMTSSMRGTVTNSSIKGKVISLPILSSHFEVDIATQNFRASTIESINTWNDVEKFIANQKTIIEAPVIFAGADADLMLDLFGAFAESLDGAESYKSAARIISEGTKSFNATRIAENLCDNPDSPLATTVKTLSSWYAKGFIHPGVFSFKNNDVEAFASKNLAAVFFIPLETHRSFSSRTISQFTSVYFPSEISPNARVFTGTTYLAINLAKAKQSEILLSEMMKPEKQENLSRATGMAPVLMQCRTPDKQADEARYWIAATTSPFAGLSNEVFLTNDQKTAIVGEIAEKIRRKK